MCVLNANIFYASHLSSLTFSYSCILRAKTSAAKTKEASEAAVAARTKAQAMRRIGSKGNKRQLNQQAEEAYKAACVDGTA
jgi:hypothetical protein